MTTQWDTVHIFISSTFKDMHAERDYLVKRVFPQLNEWCEQRRLRLVDIDLRWGVTEQDAQNQNVIKVCLERIDACRPFFLCFLGQRRGWIPKYSSNNADENNDIPLSTISEFPNLEKYAGITSVTELEIVHALVDPLHRGRQRDSAKPGEYYEPTEYAFFYLRDESYLEQIVSPELRKVFTNDSVEDDQELNKWRNEKIPATGRPKRVYTARWDPNLNTPELGLPGRLTDFQYQSFSLDNIILEDLKAAISARYPNHVENEELTNLQKEIDQQELFLFSGSEGFISRGDDFKELNDYVNGPSDRLFVLTAPAGMGKSTLLAKWIEYQRSQTVNRTNQSVVFRFIGQSDRSMTVYSLLRNLMLEIKERTGGFIKEIPEDSLSLRQKWINLSAEAARQGKLIIVIDALNQLSTGLSDLAWLPLNLPENIKLIVSFKRGEPVAEETLLRIKDQVVYTEVKPFEEIFHRKALVNAYLDQYLKQLDAQHLETLINLPGSKNPLYLKVILSELRVYGAFANLGEKIYVDFGIDPVSAFEGLLKRMESDPAYSLLDPHTAVPLLFGLLAHAQQGLSVDELAGIFIQIYQNEGIEISTQAAEDTINLYLRQVRAFIANREGRYDFFFETFKLAALNRYIGAEVPQRTAKDWHQILAEYYLRQPLMLDEKPNTQKLIEQFFQLVHAGMKDEYFNILMDYWFLETKIGAFQTQSLLNDINLALTMPGFSLEENELTFLESLEVMLRLTATALNVDRHQLAGQLYGFFQGSPNPIIQRLLDRASSKEDACWIRPVTDSLKQTSKIEIFNLVGHTERATKVVVTRDSRYAASLGFDQKLRVWDLKLGQEIWNSQSGRCQGFTSDGDHFITLSGHDQTLLQKTATGEIQKKFSAYPVQGLHLFASSSGGGRLILGKEPYSGQPDSHLLTLWHTEIPKEILQLSGHKDKVYGARISSDGLFALSWSKDQSMLMWDVESGKLIKSFQNSKEIHHLDISNNGRFAITYENSTVTIWDLETGNELRTLQYNRVLNGCLALSPDGQYALTACGPKLIVWDVSTGELVFDQQIHSKPINDLKVTPDGTKIITASDDHTLKVLDFQNVKQQSQSLSSIPNGPVSFTPDGAFAVWAKYAEAGQWQGGSQYQAFLQYFDKNVARLNQEIQLSSHSKLNKFVFTNDGSKCICVVGGAILIYDTATWQEPSLLGNKGGCRSLHLTPDGKRVVHLNNGMGTSQNSLNVWDIDSCELKLSRITRGGQVGNEPIYIPGNDGYAILRSKQNVEILSLADDESIYTIDLDVAFPNRSKIFPAALSSNAGLLACVWGSEIVIWDILNQAEVVILKEADIRSSRPNIVLFSPDDRYILAGTDTGTIWLWDIFSGAIKYEMKGHSGKILTIRFVPAINSIVSTSEDNSLRIWRWLGDCSGSAFYLGSHVVDMDVSKSGKDLIVSDGLNRVHILSLEGF